jgi:hypothetical protein
MEVFVLSVFDRDMRPRSDMVTTSIFQRKEDAVETMIKDIGSTKVNELLMDDDVKCYDNFAFSRDGRFVWKIQSHTL